MYVWGLPIIYLGVHQSISFYFFGCVKFRVHVSVYTYLKLYFS